MLLLYNSNRIIRHQSLVTKKQLYSAYVQPYYIMYWLSSLNHLYKIVFIYCYIRLELKLKI